MSIVITNPVSNIPVAPKSHTRGWSELWANLLNASIDHKCSHNILNFDTVCVDHGVNFGGTLNLFGGATQELYDKITLLFSVKDIISLDVEMPNYGEMLRGRIGNKTTYSGITSEWCDRMSTRFSNIKVLRQEDLNTKSITIGDSHSTAFSAKGDSVFRTNGKTLFGTIRKGLEHDCKGVSNRCTNITFSLGSIDIRHHILRHSDFDLNKMIKTYVEQGDEIGQTIGCDISFGAPVPVEYEARKLPKTGYFKGTPFTGTREQRHNLTVEFISRLEEASNGRVVMPPQSWYLMDPQKYAETYMEFGGSVHIAPIYYRNKNWGEI